MTTSGASSLQDIAAAKAEAPPASQPEVKPVAKPATNQVFQNQALIPRQVASIKAEAKVSGPELA